VEAKGGARKRKGFETLLSLNATVEMHIQSVIIADNAKLDQYGNWSAGERNRVLSDVGAQSDRINNTSTASLKRKGKAKRTYFIPKSGLAPGVYRRAAGGVLNIILAFSSNSPTYAPRFPFQARSQALASAVFPSRFASRLADAMRTAK
jgi:hypothetical protein